MKCWLCCFVLGLVGFCCKSQSNAVYPCSALSRTTTASNRDVPVVKSWVKEKRLLEQQRLYFEANLAIYKSTLPFGQVDGGNDLRRASHYMVPLFLGYKLDHQLSFEAGVFGGLLRNRMMDANLLSEPITPDSPVENSLNMGLIAGLSYHFDQFLRLNLHCWMGNDLTYGKARGIQFGWSVAF